MSLEMHFHAELVVVFFFSFTKKLAQHEWHFNCHSLFACFRVGKR